MVRCVLERTITDLNISGVVYMLALKLLEKLKIFLLLSYNCESFEVKQNIYILCTCTLFAQSKIIWIIKSCPV